MKNYLLILVLILCSCSKKEEDFYYYKTYGKEYSEKEIKEFKKKVIKMSIQFKKDSKKYGLDIEYPHKKFKFSIMDYNNPLNGEFQPILNNISLKKDFDKFTFYHEMGHAEFNYGHDFKHHESILDEGLESFQIPSLMSWCPSVKLQKRVERLDWDFYVKHFFTSKSFSQLSSIQSGLNHNNMLRRLALYYFVEEPNLERYNYFLQVRYNVERMYFLHFKTNYEYTREGKLIRSYEKYILSKFGDPKILKKDINFNKELLSTLEYKYNNELKQYNKGLILN